MYVHGLKAWKVLSCGSKIKIKSFIILVLIVSGSVDDPFDFYGHLFFKKKNHEVLTAASLELGSRE